jgi:hypothetical protein
MALLDYLKQKPNNYYGKQSLSKTKAYFMKVVPSLLLSTGKTL